MDKLADKLPPPALNRPPTQQRAPDPGRFRSIDMQPESAQQDPSYQRMVQDIEALQHRQGWLAGRGAFDKEDLLYLRDREEQQRMTEQEQRDAEAAAYAAARARIEREQEAAARAALRQQQTTQQQSKSSHNKGVVPVLKFKAHHSKEQQQQPAGHPVQSSGHAQEHKGPDHKRPRLTDSADAHAVAGSAGVTHVAAAAGASCSEAVQQQGSTAVGAQSIAPTCNRAPNDIASSGQQQQGQRQGEEERVGLGGLLGYNSESDESDDEDDVQPRRTGPAAISTSIRQQELQLPSAAELLEQDLPSSFAPAPSRVAAEPASPPLVGSGVAYQHHTGWI